MPDFSPPAHPSLQTHNYTRTQTSSSPLLLPCDVVVAATPAGCRPTSAPPPAGEVPYLSPPSIFVAPLPLCFPRVCLHETLSPLAWVASVTPEPSCRRLLVEDDHTTSVTYGVVLLW